MEQNSIASKAIYTAIRAEQTYCKFLSANDSGETGGHQAGILISKKALSMLFDKRLEELQHIEKRTVEIRWQDDYTTNSVFTYYESKGELRITSFGRGFPYLNKEDTGALFVLTHDYRDRYSAFILSTEEDINSFLDAYNISPTETNNILEKKIADTRDEYELIEEFIAQYTAGGKTIFPDSKYMSAQAREIENAVNNHAEYMISRPDDKIIAWTDQEYRLFRAFEMSVYGGIIRQGFMHIESFIQVANEVLNRRKSRAGKSLEHHISAIFDANRIAYEEQVRTEGNKRPDFIFPSGRAYHDSSFPVDRLVSLASKTTCKDRWRQIINEADRLRDRNKYLLTLQQGISTAQLKEMEDEKVVLVVPKPYISYYPREQQGKIWTVKKFISYLKELEA